MSEVAMWEYLRDRLKEARVPLHAERITERLSEGVADVVYLRSSPPSYTCAGLTGWLELKYLPALPKDLTKTPLLTYGKHGLQTSQAFWLNRWARHGGRAGVLLRVGTATWWYWRAEARAGWVGDIRTTWAQYHPTRVWNSFDAPGDPGPHRGPFHIDQLVTALCE